MREVGEQVALCGLFSFVLALQGLVWHVFGALDARAFHVRFRRRLLTIGAVLALVGGMLIAASA